MVQTAVFDAVNGIEQDYHPYATRARAPWFASSRAAAATAAYVVLADQFPDLRSSLTVEWFWSMAGINDPLFSRVVGALYGTATASRILALRKNDGSSMTVPYTPSGLFGRWQPTPPAFAPALLPNWPLVKPFAIQNPLQFRAPAPPDFTSPAFTMAYEEVRLLGDVDSALRTSDQTLIAYFWEDGAGTATPPGHWQVIAQQLSEEFDLSLSENARLFALLSLIQADGAICCWDSKYHWDHVRPYTFITSEADDDGNPDTHADSGWFNLIPTPPFPAYTSGHSTFSGGSSRLLALYFGTDDIAFSAPSPDPQRWPNVLPGVVRSWNSLSEAGEEAGQSRIYGGIHWQYDNQEGLKAGRALADFVFANYLQPR
jgi:hypothetical protein